MNQILRQTLFIKLWRLIGWMGIGLIVFLSVSPTLPAPVLDAKRVGEFSLFSEKKTVGTGPEEISLWHISAYGWLMWWFAQLKPRRQYLRVAVLLLLMGTGLEVLQIWIPNRALEISDMTTNWGGTALGWMFALAHSQVCFPDESLQISKIKPQTE